jgi:hypothetical protein
VGLLLGAVVGAAYWKLSLWTDVLGVLWFTISVLCLIPFCSIALFTSDRRYFLVREPFCSSPPSRSLSVPSTRYSDEYGRLTHGGTPLAGI